MFATLKWSALSLLCVLLMGSCAIGYDSPDGFDSGVNNMQVTSPDSISFVIDPDGTMATLSWPVSMGAKGYNISLYNVDDPDMPIELEGYVNKFVDGTTLRFPVTEDTKYRFELQALGDPDRGNSDDQVKVYPISTLVEAVRLIPSGSDIYQYMLENPLDSTTWDREVAIELEPGGQYTMSGILDFAGQKMTLRSDKLNRAVVNMTENGGFCSYSGLKVKFINFDCTDFTGNSIFYMSADSVCPDKIKGLALGYSRDGNNGDMKEVNYVLDPWYFSEIWVKNLPKAFIHDNNTKSAWWHMIFNDCMFQMKNSSSIPFIALEKQGRLIKNLKFQNSTLWNIENNSSAFFIRYYNSSNSNVVKVFGNTTSEHASSTLTFENCTVVRCNTQKDFMNNFNGSGNTTTVSHCVWYDCYRVARRAGVGTLKLYSFNFWRHTEDCPSDDTDYTNKSTDGSPFAVRCNGIEGDPGLLQFGGDPKQEMDLNAPNGGANFTPNLSAIKQADAGKGAGDPRWLK